MEQQQTQDNVQYMDGILNRLLEHYLTSATLPGKEGQRLSATLFHHLARCVVGEGYGEKALPSPLPLHGDSDDFHL